MAAQLLNSGLLLGVIGGGAFLLYNSLFTVEAGHRAIIYNKISGINDNKFFSEGTHFKLVYFDRPIRYDVRTKPRVLTSLTGTKDLQMVNITLRVLCRPDTSQLQTIYRNLGLDWDERVIPSIANEVLKAIVARFNATQLLTQREQVSRLIRQELVQRAKDFNIVVDDVSVTHLSFGKEFSDSIEAKQVAAQNAERAKYVVQQAEQEKLATIIRAEGETKAAELIGKSIEKNPAYLKLRKIELSQEIAQIISQSRNRVLLDSSSLLINVSQLLSE